MPNKEVYSPLLDAVLKQVGAIENDVTYYDFYDNSIHGRGEKKLLSLDLPSGDMLLVYYPPAYYGASLVGKDPILYYPTKLADQIHATIASVDKEHEFSARRYDFY
ncbi:MAG: hypothetical protein WCV81_05550 [Microgenomates group bacterium]|jgi:hypothetical protein